MRKIECEQEFDSEFETFLNGLKKNSRNAYRSLFAYWVNFTHMNGKETLEFKRADKDANTEKKILAFKKYIIGLGKSENFARLGTGAIRGFYASHRMPLVFIQSERREIQEANRKTVDYPFSKEDLAKMSEQANLTERYIVLVGKSVGFRAGDFLNFTYGDFRSVHVEGETPISLGEIVTQKEHVKAYPFLDSDAQNVVKAMLERNPEKKDSDKVLEFDEHTLSLTLQRLFERAHLVSGSKRVRFHGLRKYLFDRLTAVASTEQSKQIIGKKISESAYLTTEQLRDIYLRAMPSIVINGNGKNHVALEALTETVQRLEKEIASKDAEIEILRKNQKTFEKSIADLMTLPTVKKELFERKEKVPID